tara:strand:+ start:93 stop:497 length:405 start_codon:yes stop_codon:yes gene_type:complete
MDEIDNDLIEIKKPTQRCCKTVYPREAYGSFKGGQCDRWGRYEHDGRVFCKQHHPATAKKRQDEEREKCRQGDAKRAHAGALYDHERKAIDTIKKIAGGDNDPRTTAQAFLDEQKRLQDLTIDDYLKGKNDENK